MTGPEWNGGYYERVSVADGTVFEAHHRQRRRMTLGRQCHRLDVGKKEYPRSRCGGKRKTYVTRIGEASRDGAILDLGKPSWLVESGGCRLVSAAFRMMGWVGWKGWRWPFRKGSCPTGWTSVGSREG